MIYIVTQQQETFLLQILYFKFVKIYIYKRIEPQLSQELQTNSDKKLLIYP